MDYVRYDGIYWMLHNFLFVLLIVVFLIAFTLFIRRRNLNQTQKYSIIAAASLLAFLFVMSYFGYQFYFIFSLIEWATKFVLPWVVLYWLVRAIKVLEKKS
jgi:hypothetical protein